MKILFDETFTSTDGKQTSRNIWYGYAEISWGVCENNFMDNLCKIIKNDLSKNTSNTPTETNW